MGITLGLGWLESSLALPLLGYRKAVLMISAMGCAGYFVLNGAQ